MDIKLVLIFTITAVAAQPGPTCYPNQDRIQYVQEGQRVTVECPCNGTENLNNHTRLLSHWSINGSPTRQDRLPERHTVNDQELIISPVKTSENGTTYQCRFIEYNQRGTSVTIIVNSTEMIIVNTRDTTTRDTTTRDTGTRAPSSGSAAVYHVLYVIFSLYVASLPF